MECGGGHQWDITQIGRSTNWLGRVLGSTMQNCAMKKVVSNFEHFGSSHRQEAHYSAPHFSHCTIRR